MNMRPYEELPIRSKVLGILDSRLAVFYGLFLAVGAVVMIWPPEIALGWRIFAVAVFYSLALPLFATRCVEPRWIRIWSFLLPLSVFQVLPDWHLVHLGILEFPDLGFPKIGPVSGFMALLWIVPLLLIVELGEELAERRGPAVAGGGVAVLSLLLFLAAEAVLPHLAVWRPVGVTTVGTVALYVLLPETLLGLSAWWAFRKTDARAALWKLAAAAGVAATYAATLHICYLLVEW